MFGTILRRVVVKALDRVEEDTRASKHAVVRGSAKVMRSARRLVNLDQIATSGPLPAWTSTRADQPLWESDRKKLTKWRSERGIPDPMAPPGAAPESAPPPAAPVTPSAGAASAEATPAVATKRGRRLPVVGSQVLHPESSPFETDAMGQPVAESPSAVPLEGEALLAEVLAVLKDCRPLLQADGGDVELLDIQGNTVHVRLTGNCIGCPSAQATLHQGIERRLRARLPQIEKVVAPGLLG